MIHADLAFTRRLTSWLKSHDLCASKWAQRRGASQASRSLAYGCFGLDSFIKLRAHTHTRLVRHTAWLLVKSIQLATHPAAGPIRNRSWWPYVYLLRSAFSAPACCVGPSVSKTGPWRGDLRLASASVLNAPPGQWRWSKKGPFKLCETGWLRSKTHHLLIAATSRAFSYEIAYFSQTGHTSSLAGWLAGRILALEAHTQIHTA